ncbi:MAG: SMC family ATPase [Thermoplasmata archaeon]
MIIKSIELKNIRSYVQAKIVIPKGKVVLLGDIGAGKSSILMSIEFALFGLGDQDGASLIRVNEKEGYVLLEIEIDGKLYRIKRTLKRKNDKVFQDKVVIEFNNEKKVISPTEAKVYILNILNFNEPTNPNARSNIFRYAIYTPQEEMKKILGINVDERKKTIRKALRIEDFSVARENSKIVLEYLNKRSEFYKGKAEDLEVLENSVKNLENEINTLNSEMSSVKGKINEYELKELEYNDKFKKINEELRLISQDIAKLDVKKKDLEKGIKELKTIENSIKDLMDNLDEKIKIHKKNMPIKDFDIEKDELENEISQLDDNLDRLNEEKNELIRKDEELNNIEKNIKKLSKEREDLWNEMKEKEKIVETIKNENKKPEIVENLKIEDLENEENKIIEKINELNKKSGIISGKIQDYEKIIQDGICPTCERNADPKEFGFKLEKRKTELIEIEQDIFNLNSRKIELEKRKKNLIDLEKRLIEFDKLNQKMLEYERDIKQINEKIKEKEEEISSLNERASKLKLEVEKIDEIKKYIKEINDKKKKLREIKKKIDEYEEKMKHYNEEENEINILKEKINLNEKNRDELIKKLDEIKIEITNLEPKIEEHKKKNEELKTLNETMERIKKEKENIITEKTKIETQINEKRKLLDEYKTELEEKKRALKLSEKYTEYARWIKEIFIPGLEEIERIVFEMKRREFNNLFTDWFYVLVDDPTKSARVDEDFTPIVEQDGYVQELDYLSGGERSAISLAYRLALNSLVRETMGKSKENLLILDEPTEGFSTVQVNKFPNILNKIDCDQIIVVSHEEIIETMADHVIRIKKENGISKIEV